MGIFNLKRKILGSSLKLNKNYQSSLSKSKGHLKIFFQKIFSRHKKIDEVFFQDLEEFLIDFNVEYNFAKFLIDELKKETKIHNLKEDEINQFLIEKIINGYKSFIDDKKYQLNLSDKKPSIILVAGVNGSGKTTFIGKLANYLKTQNHKKVLLVAADTFRPAASHQLQYWANEAGVDIILPEKDKQDPSSLLYKGINYALTNKHDVIICDTSGRLENKINLMNQLKKMYNISNKLLGYEPSEFLIVLDITTGYHLIEQIKGFQTIGQVSGFVLNKVDGSSKPGIILSFPEEFSIPIKFLGIGEKINDLEIFKPEQFIYNLFNFQ
ncbi:signal recognition particle-docking protein FtsY [Mycoplasma sp. SG1]|uniref:signal recognition particle-docking protein FtsY n=1 Tax=Mycoplasma sp. SG1 TaxID=2810348 RepID=UPI0020256AE6|nr:signal recognition particle-docking protein FtsY [Mycoplasma sp. SG1]URM53239.1 signal recognition particle-docking protein FtsY [Mycoplasma sp. SG1]